MQKNAYIRISKSRAEKMPMLRACSSPGEDLAPTAGGSQPVQLQTLHPGLHFKNVLNKTIKKGKEGGSVLLSWEASMDIGK